MVFTNPSQYIFNFISIDFLWRNIAILLVFYEINVYIYFGRIYEKIVLQIYFTKEQFVRFHVIMCVCGWERERERITKTSALFVFATFAIFQIHFITLSKQIQIWLRLIVFWVIFIKIFARIALHYCVRSTARITTTTITIFFNARIIWWEIRKERSNFISCRGAFRLCICLYSTHYNLCLFIQKQGLQKKIKRKCGNLKWMAKRLLSLFIYFIIIFYGTGIMH